MNAPRPAMLSFLRSVIVALTFGGAVGSGFLGGVAWGQSTPAGFSYIPGGSFTMGVTSGDTDSDAPPITVTVSPFYIQQTETTKAQWDEVRTWAVNNGYTDLTVGAGKAANHPVQTVTWWDVVKWCNARSEKEGLTPVYTVSGAVMRTGTTEPVPNWSANGYRLPTEAEWEKAARGGVSGKRFPWGTDTISHAQANYRVYSQNGTTNFYSYDVEPRPPATGTNYYHPSYTTGAQPYTSPVRSFAANGYGLYDMSGNVWEWSWDWYGSSYYTTSNGTTDPRGPASGSDRVFRGGGWGSVAIDARCADRGHSTPGLTDDSLGFRPTRSADTDSDGVNDYREIKDGTNPNDASSLNPLSKGLVAYYPFDGNVNDESGNNNTATPLNISYGADQNSSVNSAAQFLRGSAIDVPSLNSIPFKPITYGFWVKFNSILPNAQTTLIGRKQARNQEDGAITIYDLEGFNKKLFYHTGGSGVNSDFTPQTDLWYHITFTQSSDSFARFYVNGSLIKEVNFTAPQSAFFPFRIGAESALQGITTGEPVFDGALNDVRIYNRALSATEVQALYAGEATVQITAQPLSRTVNQDQPVTFTVSATGSGTLTYQWQKDGVDIPGATSSSFVVSNVQSSNVGFYRCVVTDNFGDAFSNEASLRIFGLPLFKVVQNSLHWHQAKGDAVSNGGRLAVAETQEKIDHLNAWLQSINNSRHLWIGLTDEDSEGSWKWIDGTPLGVSNWASGEPNNNESGEDYAHVLGVSDQSRWNDLPTDWWIYTPGGYILEVLATPVITTPTATSITAIGATLGGNVTSDGGAAITECGVVYSATATNNDPIISGTGVTKVTASGTTGVFTAPAITGLTQGTDYSYKAYAINSQGTTYTSVATFTTQSTNADLSALTLSSGTLSPTFASATTAYTASVSNATTSITVTPTRAQANATIEARVNTGTYAAVTSGSPSAALSLNVGSNTVDIRVTAQDGFTQKTYKVTVTRMAAPMETEFDAADDFSGENPNRVWTYGFAPENELGTTFYFLNKYLLNSDIQIWNASETSELPAIWKNTSSYLSFGVPANKISLHPGQNEEQDLYSILRFTAPRNGIYKASIKFYSGDAGDTNGLIILNRDISNPLLSAIETSSNPIFIGDLSLLAGDTVDIMVGPKGSVWSDNTPVDVNFTAISTNADLSTLTLSSGTLSPTFASATTAYTASVSNATTSITVMPTRAQANATIEARVNAGTYAAVTSGGPSDALSLNVGTNTVDVRVTAQAGNTTTYTVTVTRMATQSITFANPGAQLANATVNLSATGGGSGNPVTFTVEGPATLGGGNVLSFTGAGSVTVRANQAGNDLYHPAPEVAQTFTVTKATATVTLGNLSQTYDGTPKAATAMTDPSGKTVVFTYEGSSTAPTNAGSYAVVGTIDDPIYQGSATGTLTIAKAAQSITFGAIPDKLTTDTVTLTATGGDSGNPVTFAVTAGPASITDGILSFTGAGNVTVTASQAGNANYEAATPVSRTFTVTKATATVTLGSLSQTYDGTPKSATATTNPSGKTVALTYDDSPTPPTDAGFYIVTGTVDDPIYQGSASRILVIAKAAQIIAFAAIPEKLTTDTITLTATGGGSGNPVNFAVTGGPASITDGILSFTGAGNVTVTASQAGNANYEAATSVARTFTVTKATATVTLGNLSQTYDGTPKTATATTDPSGKTVVFTYDGGTTAPTNAGSYAVVGTIDDPIYQGSASGTLEIAKASQVITFASIPNKLTTDTVNVSATGGGSGNPVTFAVTEGPATITSGVLGFTGAGSVTVTASQAGNANYEAAAAVSRTFTVTKATATVTLGNLSQTYDGTPKSATATTDPVGKTVVFTYDGSATAPTNAGSYEVVGTIDDAIYQGSANGTLEIAKATQTITFASIPNKLTTDTITLSATGGGSGNPVTFAVTGGPASITDGILSFTGAGNVTVTASQAGNANYEAATPVSRTFTVTKATATVTLGSLSQTYDGTPKSATATTDPIGKTVVFTYDGSATAPTNAGSYAVVATIDDPIYQGSANGTLEIAKATQTITFASIPNKLTTDTITLSATGGGSGNPVTFAVTEGPASITNAVLSFTGAGNVTVTASQAGNANYESATSVSRTFTVTKANASVTLGSLSQTYNGTPKSATATTDPAGKTVVFTYEGSSTAPTNAGSYAVVGTIDDPIYQGSATGTLQIAKASQTIAFPNPGPQLANATVTLSATGGGSGNPVTFTVEGPAALGVGNVLSFTGPGSVTVRANQAGNANYEDAVEVSHTFTVSKAPATLTLSRLHQVADGTAREVVVTTNPADLDIDLTYNGTTDAPIAPGSYDVVATSADDRYEGSASGTLVVDDPARSVRVPGGGLPTLGELTVPTFSIGAYEVTGSQWTTVVAWAEANAGYDFAGAGAAASGDLPVSGISWFDAAKWCNARTERENTLLGKSLAPAYQVAGAVYRTGTPASPADLNCDFSAGGYRLPTAAEWEFAARGGASGVPATYPGGNTLDELGWYVGNSNGAIQPAGGKTANGLGLYDLAGNAAEWTWDAPSWAPGQRFLRGGAWSSTATACELNALASETASLRLDRSGFRLVRSISLALSAALDAPELDWESGGDEAWFAQTGMTHDGIDAAESGAVAPGQSSWLETTVTGPCNLRFRWEASQRAALDVFRLETGIGDPILLTGPGDWEERLVELPAGDHSLRWVFARDAASTGTSRVRLDAVSVTTATVPTVTTAAASEVSGSGATLGGEVTADGGRTVTERGVVYSTSPQPTLASPGALAAATSGTGTFSVAASGLSEGTTYFARAYATNNLGTAYGAEIVLTTDTAVILTDGIGRVTGRSILAGDTQRFRFGLARPSVTAFTITGMDSAIWELRDGNGGAVVSGTGNSGIGRVLLAGNYALSITNGGATVPAFSLSIDASVEALPKPDASIGTTPSATIGINAYAPTVQQGSVNSKRAVPKTFFAQVGNDGLLPDAMRLRGSAGNRLFAVSYFSGRANVTARMVAGTFATAVMGPDDAAVRLTITVAPNKGRVTEEVRQGGRLVTRYLRKTYSGFIKARAAGNTALSDTVRYQVTTTP